MVSTFTSVDQNHCMAQDSHKTFHRSALCAPALQLCFLEYFKATRSPFQVHMRTGALKGVMTELLTKGTCTSTNARLKLDWRAQAAYCFSMHLMLVTNPPSRSALIHVSRMLLKHHCLQITASLPSISKGSKHESVHTWPYYICRHDPARMTCTLTATPDRVPCKPCSDLMSA